MGVSTYLQITYLKNFFRYKKIIWRKKGVNDVISFIINYTIISCSRVIVWLGRVYLKVYSAKYIIKLSYFEYIKQ